MSWSQEKNCDLEYCRQKGSKKCEMADRNTFFTEEELKIIGNLCETIKHWRRHNPELRFPDTLYLMYMVIP
jgi:hypothetical protein